jgi:hypothetical protein
MTRNARRAILVIVTLLASSLWLPYLGSAQSARVVTASARCVDAGSGQLPEVIVSLTNQTGAPLTVSYTHGFTTTQAFDILMQTAYAGDVSPIVMQNGETRTLRAKWDDLRQGPGSFGAALVVTNAGALVPLCSDRPVDADQILLGPAPVSVDEARREAVQIATQMLGQLESWRAYPALYQLLHPNARAEVPFAALACWYAERYGLPGEPRRTMVFGYAVDDIAFGSWTWAVTGQTYPDAAAVAYREKIGTIAATEEVPSSMHLVEAGGQWRWFFGISRAGLDALPADCQLTPNA